MPRELPDVLRRQVASRAQFRCEYCLYPEERSGFLHQVDHIISRKHGGLSTLNNLAYCCLFCNRYKGSDVAAIDAQSGEALRLFHPRQDQWSDHFQISGALIEPLSRIGEATVRLLRLNRAERVVERATLQSMGSYPRASNRPDM